MTPATIRAIMITPPTAHTTAAMTAVLLIPLSFPITSPTFGDLVVVRTEDEEEGLESPSVAVDAGSFGSVTTAGDGVIEGGNSGVVVICVALVVSVDKMVFVGGFVVMAGLGGLQMSSRDPGVSEQRARLKESHGTRWAHAHDDVSNERVKLKNCLTLSLKADRKSGKAGGGMREAGRPVTLGPQSERL